MKFSQAGTIKYGTLRNDTVGEENGLIRFLFLETWKGGVAIEG